MARITVEDCLEKEPNRFVLVHIAEKRTKQLLRGAPSVSDSKKSNKPVVTSLREISEGKVGLLSDEEIQAREEARLREQELKAEAAAPVEAPVASPKESPNGSADLGELKIGS